MALHVPPLTPTLPPCQLSPSRPLAFPQTHLLLLRHNSRFATLLHAVGTRNNDSFDPWKKLDGNNDDDDDDDDMVFLRRRSGRRSRRRQWWYGNNQVEGEQVGGIVDQLVDNLWILQVFRSYGLFLPVILISLLLATGPKAFLMGSGIPFGLSLLAFAFNKLLEWLDSSHITNPKPKSRRRRSRFNRRREVPIENEYSEKRETEQGGKSRSSYQTTVSNFGGWDELVTEEETDRTRNPSVTETRLEMMRERKVGSSMEKRELPLLLRLVVALFPFLGSWTNLL